MHLHDRFDNAVGLRQVLVVGPEYYRHIAIITDVARQLQIPRHIKSAATLIEEYALNPERSISSLKRLIAICEQTARQGVPGIVVLTCPTLPLSVSYTQQEKAQRLLQAFITGLTTRAPQFLLVIVADHHKHIPASLIGSHQQIPALSPEALAHLKHQITLRVLSATSKYWDEIDFDKLAAWAQNIDIAALVAAFKLRSGNRMAAGQITEYDLAVALYHATTSEVRKHFLEQQLVGMLEFDEIPTR